MISALCNVALSYSPQDFGNWFSGMGNFLVGLGTIGLAYAALKTIPEQFAKKYKDPHLVELYQKVFYRMYRNVEASREGIVLTLPHDIEALSQLIIQRYPEVGSKDSVYKLLDDLMLDDFLKITQGNATVMKTIKWDPKDRGKPVPPIVEDIPSEPK
jgi:hypothetical protein